MVTDEAELSGWYAQLQQRARHDFLVFDRPPYVSSPIEPLEEASMRRGVAVRAVYVPASFERPGAWDEVLRLTSLGEQARLVPDLPLKLAIADRRTMLVALSLDALAVEALVTSAPAIVNAMSNLFDMYWARGVAFGADTVSPPPTVDDAHVDNDGLAARRRTTRTEPHGATLSVEDRNVVVLIAGGATDEAIARRLGVSPRSVRRRTQALMLRLGATNRFQFGVLAERAGWT